jgi:hypothetical protein
MVVVSERLGGVPFPENCVFRISERRFPSHVQQKAVVAEHDLEFGNAKVKGKTSRPNPFALLPQHRHISTLLR